MISNPSGTGIFPVFETVFSEVPGALSETERPTVSSGECEPVAETDCSEDSASASATVSPESPPTTVSDSAPTGSSLEANGGLNDMRSAEYPENEVVNQNGTTGIHEAWVRSLGTETLLILNADEVEASILTDVFLSVWPVNERRRNGQEYSAQSKYPVDVAIFCSYKPPVAE